jgi:hypothetical protein
VLVELGDPRAARQPIQARIAYHERLSPGARPGDPSPASLALARRSRRGAGALPTNSKSAAAAPGSTTWCSRDRPRSSARARRAPRGAVPGYDCHRQSGCTLQIAAAAREIGYNWPIFHPFELDRRLHSRRRPRGARLMLGWWMVVGDS